MNARGRATRNLPALLVLSLAVALSAWPAPHGAQAGEGQLDPAFGGGDGRVNDNFDGVGRRDQANAVVVQPDGKIVVAVEAQFNERGFDFGLARYNPDGTLDASFGAGGKVLTDFPYPVNSGDRPFALALQPDGKIVAAGTANLDFALARYNSDGTLDASFGAGGLVVTDFFGGNDLAHGVALQPDGKIVAAGVAGRTNTGAEFAVARYNADGSPDTTFGDADAGSGARLGRVATDFEAWNDFGRGVALQADGRIVVAGYTQTPSTNHDDFALARYLADGTLDPSFGGDGRVTTRFFEDDRVDDERAYAVRVQSDGKIVAAGFAWDRNETEPATRWEDFALARYNADGTLDATFGGGDGLVVTNVEVEEGGVGNAGLATKDRAHALLLQPDGRLVAGGFASCCSDDGEEDFALARYNTDGSLDVTFGSGGLTRTDFFGRHDGSDDEIYGMALQADGRILAVGRAEKDPRVASYDYAVARYTGSSAAPPTPTPTPSPSPSPAPLRVNFALASNGAVATASSQYSVSFQASAAINGDRRNLQAGAGYNMWHGATRAKPDWLEVSFAGPRTIDEVGVFTQRDDFESGVAPTEADTFTKYGLRDFEIQYWDGSAWRAVPGCQVSGNISVWKKLTFAPLTTTKLRLFVTATADGYSRVWELEAWGLADAQPQPTPTPAPTPTSGRVNFALSSNGASAAVSSQYSASFPAAAAINGDRHALLAGAGYNMWHGAFRTKPDWLEVTFAGARTIDEVGVFTQRDDYETQGEATEQTTFTKYGLRDFEIQYWTGSAWAAVPGAQAAGNDRVWRKFTFAPITTTKLRLVVNATADGYSRVWELEAWGPGGQTARTNVALAANGASASASSQLNSQFPVAAVIDGDRRSLRMADGRYNIWHGSTTAKPDWVEVSFAGAKTIGEVGVVTQQDDYNNPVEPSEQMAFASYGLTEFDVQFWDGSRWVTLPGGAVAGNDRVWRRVLFAPVTTTKMRVLIRATKDGYSRVMEIEAWTP